MVYLGEKNLNNNKKIYSELTAIFGIGPKKAKAICAKLGIQSECSFNLLTKSQENNLKLLLNRENIGKTLLRDKATKVKTLINKRCYRGFRHRNNLPVRGQRTHTNGKTQKKNNNRFNF